MIDRAQDSIDTEIGQSSSTPIETSPAVTPDIAKTQEVVEQHENFEVHTQIEPATEPKYARGLHPSIRHIDEVAYIETPAVGEDGIVTDTGVAEKLQFQPYEAPAKDLTENTAKSAAEVFGDSNVSAYSNEEALPAEPVLNLDPSLIGAHDAHPVIDSYSATQYAPQTPPDEDTLAIARANALHPEDNRADEVIDAVAQRRVAQVGHAPGAERQGRGKNKNRPNREQPQHSQPQGQRTALPPASQESLARLKDFEKVRTENSVRNFSKKQAQQRDQREAGKHGQQLPNDRQPKPQQAETPRAPQVPALVRSERTVNFLKEAMNDRDWSLRDGKDHINTSAEARTRLGRLLDTNAFAPFNHPDLGAFNSLSGMWYYVTGVTSDEAFRDLAGKNCLRRGTEMEKRHVPGLRSIIAEATWFKVTQHKELGKLMSQNTLPFRCYFTPPADAVNRQPRLVEIEHWYMPVLDEIGRAMRAFHVDGQQDAAPDFSFLQGLPPTRPAERAVKPRDQRDQRPRKPQQAQQQPRRERQERQRDDRGAAVLQDREPAPRAVK